MSKLSNLSAGVVLGLCVAALITFLVGVWVGAVIERGIIKEGAVVEERQHTRVIEQCNRINLLSCIACHDFPAYVIDVQPEIWEE